MGKKEVMIIGAGKLGRVFLGDLFDKAGYHLILVNGTPRLIDPLNAQGYYTIFLNSSEGLEKRRITGFEAYASGRDFDTCARRLSEIDLACVCLYPQANDSVADLLYAAMMRRRARQVEDPLNVIFFVNYIYPSDLLRKMVNERCQNDEERAYCTTYLGLVEGLPYRGGYHPLPEMLQEDPYCVYGYKMEDAMPVGDGFVGPRPDIPTMSYVDRVQGRLVMKVWCGNMRACIGAAIGQRKGFTYVHETVQDRYLRKCVDYASQEANFGIAQEFGFTQQEVNGRFQNAWQQLANPTRVDLLTRVAADPIRKLRRDDRLIGPALLAIKHGRLPFYLARGAAYLMRFENPDDPSCVEMHERIAQQGVEKAIETLCQLDRSKREEEVIYQLVLDQYRELLDHDVDPQTL